MAGILRSAVSALAIWEQGAGIGALVGVRVKFHVYERNLVSVLFVERILGVTRSSPKLLLCTIVLAPSVLPQRVSDRFLLQVLQSFRLFLYFHSVQILEKPLLVAIQLAFCLELLIGKSATRRAEAAWPFILGMADLLQQR